MKTPRELFCDVWKRDKKLVVFPKGGSYITPVTLRHPIIVSAGYSGLPKALEKVQEVLEKAASDAPTVDASEQMWRPLGCPDEKTFLREAVCCSVYRGREYGKARTELIAKVGVPAKKVFLGIPRRKILPYRTPVESVVEVVRAMHEKAEKARGKQSGLPGVILLDKASGKKTTLP
jgi:hypothetical protein